MRRGEGLPALAFMTSLMAGGMAAALGLGAFVFQALVAALGTGLWWAWAGRSAVERDRREDEACERALARLRGAQTSLMYRSNPTSGDRALQKARQAIAEVRTVAEIGPRSVHVSGTAHMLIEIRWSAHRKNLVLRVHQFGGSWTAACGWETISGVYPGEHFERVLREFR